jgi:hypothetical protein
MEKERQNLEYEKLEELLERNKEIIKLWKKIFEKKKGEIGYKLVQAEYENLTKGISIHVFIDKYGDTYTKINEDQIEVEENELLIYSFRGKNRLKDFIEYAAPYGSIYSIIREMNLEKEFSKFEEKNNNSNLLLEFYKKLDSKAQEIFLKNLIAKQVDNYINYSFNQIEEFIGPQVMYIVK